MRAFHVAGRFCKRIDVTLPAEEAIRMAAQKTASTAVRSHVSAHGRHDICEQRRLQIEHKRFPSKRFYSNRSCSPSFAAVSGTQARTTFACLPSWASMFLFCGSTQSVSYPRAHVGQMLSEAERSASGFCKESLLGQEAAVHPAEGGLCIHTLNFAFSLSQEGGESHALV